MEYIQQTEVSPLITKGVCKVCYVGQQENRNNTVITKEVATEMGRKLPGSPIVGYYNQEEKDFEGHNKDIVLQDGKFEIVDTTRPYGFVPTNANVWFQKFNDEGVEHEYLVTDVYIWTEAFPESKRIFDKGGNNQSMELNSENQKGFWTNKDNSTTRIFIYNEALIEKLCILGQKVEPCFEGAQIAKEFSLEGNPEFREFKNTMFSMITELQETLNKGGSQETMEDNKKLENEFEKKPEDEDTKDSKSQEDSSNSETSKKNEGEEKKKKEYNLEEIPEYVELTGNYVKLQNEYNTIKAAHDTLQQEVAGLKEFKLAAERKSKESLIDSFYMLSEADKKDVTDNIDNYSLDDIEAKLSILCVRNKVDFNLDKNAASNNQDNKPQGLFGLQDAVEKDSAPAWVAAVRETAKKC